MKIHTSKRWSQSRVEGEAGKEVGAGCPPENLPEVASHDLLGVNRRIQKQADDLGLKISNYEGFARGRWNSDEGYTPAGMWVFTVEASDPSKTLDHEPANIVAENITDALKKMTEWAKYLFD